MKLRMVEHLVTSLKLQSRLQIKQGNIQLGNLLKNTAIDVKRLYENNQALQAKIDALMLEYCPDEMTPQQVNKWQKSLKMSTDSDLDISKVKENNND